MKGPLRLIQVLILLIPFKLAAGQSAVSPIDPNARALLFQLHSNGAVGAFDGITISMKWHSDSSRARRLGLTVDGDLLFSDERSRQSVRLEGHYLILKYRPTRTPVQLYYGIGPLAGVRVNRQGAGGTVHAHMDASLGAAGALGVE